MKRVLLIVLALVTFIVAVTAATPLSFVLRKSPLSTFGVGWQQARGTIWKGQVVGLARDGLPLGSIDLTMSPLRLIGAGGAHRLTWRDGQSRAVAEIDVGRSQVALDRVGAEMSLAQFAPAITEAFSTPNARLRVRRGSIVYGTRGCERASGTVTSDMLEEMGAQLGRVFPELTGTLACDEGRLQAHLEGRADDGTVIAVQAREGDVISITLDNLSRETGFALAAAGYSVTGTHFEYTVPLSEEAS